MQAVVEGSLMFHGISNLIKKKTYYKLKHRRDLWCWLHPYLTFNVLFVVYMLGLIVHVINTSLKALVPQFRNRQFNNFQTIIYFWYCKHEGLLSGWLFIIFCKYSVLYWKYYFSESTVQRCRKYAKYIFTIPCFYFYLKCDESLLKIVSKAFFYYQG